MQDCTDAQTRLNVSRVRSGKCRFSQMSPHLFVKSLHQYYERSSFPNMTLSDFNSQHAR